MKRIYVVTDLGPGDGGKGSIIHSLSQKIDASVIIKRGGAQGSHGVRTSRGESFNFSQWGCGTLEGVPTYLSHQMVIMPVGLKNESEALKRLGIYDPFSMISADPSCICATPYHKIASQIEELLLKDNPRGTVGTGVGQAYRMNEKNGDFMTIRTFDLQKPCVINRKLSLQRKFYLEKYKHLTKYDVLSEEDADLLSENLNLLHDDDFCLNTENLFSDIGQKLKLRELDEVIKDEGSAIVECSHGVLTDAKMGLKPHVSAIRTLPYFTEYMLKNVGYDGEIINLGVHRAYEIRHGAGPMPTYDPNFTKQMLPGSHKDENRWQGAVRAGALDFILLSRALEICEATTFDGIALTWFDQILANGRIWPYCTSYSCGAYWADSSKLDQEYTDFLNMSNPFINEIRIQNPIEKQELFELVNSQIKKLTNTQLKILSVGPTELDKIYSKNF